MDQSLPLELEEVRNEVKKALGGLVPAGHPRTDAEARSLVLSSRTEAGRSIPAYYLVYFLLVDLLNFPHIGRSEKSSWTVPVRINNRLYGIEYRKLGIGVFAPSLDDGNTKSQKPTVQAESDAREIVSLIRRGIIAAAPYFKWRAAVIAKGINLNVKNKSNWLFSRYLFFRKQYFTIRTEHENWEREQIAARNKEQAEDTGLLTYELLSMASKRKSVPDEAEWCGQAAIDAFFSWTEHVFIHIGILQQRVTTGEEVAELADSDWAEKYKSALDLSDTDSKRHYDLLIQLRRQVRNFMAHGAFGKQGEAFEFHSGTGAVPLLLTGNQKTKFTLTGKPILAEDEAISQIDKFIEHLWSGKRLQAQIYIERNIPTILPYATDGTYKRAMSSESEMNRLVESLLYQIDQAANMDW